MLWGISWLNVQTMLNDSARIDDTHTETDGDQKGKNVVHRELKSKEDIKNYIKGII